MKNYKGKFLFIPAEGRHSIIDNSDESHFLAGNFNDFVHQVLNCDFYEAVTIQLPNGSRYQMLVDECGLLKDNFKVNRFAWFLYSRFNLQAPIAGNALICKLCYEDFGEGFPEHDFCCLDDNDIKFFESTYRLFL